MADYYTHFSVVLEKLTPSEAAWLKAEITKAQSEEDPNTGGTMADFEAKLEADEMWFHDNGEWGNVEHVASLVQKFLKQFRPAASWGFEWSNDCSKPRLDAYGGGAVFVTAAEIRWLNTGTWLSEQK